MEALFSCSWPRARIISVRQLFFGQTSKIWKEKKKKKHDVMCLTSRTVGSENCKNFNFPRVVTTKLSQAIQKWLDDPSNSKLKVVRNKKSTLSLTWKDFQFIFSVEISDSRQKIDLNKAQRNVSIHFLMKIANDEKCSVISSHNGVTCCGNFHVS